MENQNCNVVVLVACMHQVDKTILKRLNIQSSFVVINQCDNDKVEECEITSLNGDCFRGIFVNTKERGLSKSRNMAIKYAPSGSLCLICDDDEELADNYPSMISNAYKELSEADVITFNVNYKTERYNYKKQYIKNTRLGFQELLKVSSFQITFKRDKVLENDIYFDKKMGSGTGNGGGEENRFLLDCRNKHLKIWGVPELLATIVPSGRSQWFSGFNKDYFVTYGWSTRRMLGFCLGYAYIWYNSINHRNLYCQELNLFQVIKAFHKGFFQKR